MNKEFAPYELALRLKKLGFNETCLGIFYPSVDEVKTISTDFFNEKAIVEKGFIKAPTFSQAFRWIRDNYKIISVIDFYNDGEEWEDTEYKVTISEFEHFATHDTFVKEGYISHEEAELACLDKLIEIIEQTQ